MCMVLVVSELCLQENRPSFCLAFLSAVIHLSACQAVLIEPESGFKSKRTYRLLVVVFYFVSEVEGPIVIPRKELTRVPQGHRSSLQGTRVCTVLSTTRLLATYPLCNKASGDWIGLDWPAQQASLVCTLHKRFTVKVHMYGGMSTSAKAKILSARKAETHR